MVDANGTQVRVLMFPWLGHGHVFPFLELAKALAKKHFHIYLCSTPINLHSIKNRLDLDSSYCNNNDEGVAIDLVELCMPSLPDLPPHYHTTKNIPPHLIPTLIKAFQMSCLAFSDIITDLNPDLLIYDGLQPWAAKAAAAHGIPAVYFSTSGATSFAFSHHFFTHKSWDSFPHEAIWLRGHEKRDRMGGGSKREIRDAGEGFFYGVFDLSRDVVLMKTCRGLEGKYMDYLSTLCGRKIVPTGPLITFADNIQENGGGSEIMEWLSCKKQCSTLYISFGSENYLSKAQMREIAKGLELISAEVNFIWVARKPVGSDEVAIEDAVPQGFLERVSERGIVVRGWAPQAAILAHPSVGGFMSHCGWGSITESMYFGVAVVALPLKHDQPVNARLVVEAGVGVEVARDEDGGFDGNGVAEAVKEVVSVEESGERLRRRAREISKDMKREGEEAIDGVVAELLNICIKNQ